MSLSDNEYSDGEEDHAMDNIRAMLQDYYGTDNGGEVKEEWIVRCSIRTSTFPFGCDEDIMTRKS